MLRWSGWPVYTSRPSRVIFCQPASFGARSPRCMNTDTTNRPSEYPRSSTGPERVGAAPASNRDRPPGSAAGTGQPRARIRVTSTAVSSRRRALADAAAGPVRGGRADLEVDEDVLADQVRAGVEYLTAQRQLGRLVQPEPRRQRAVLAARLDHLRGPVVRRARARVGQVVVGAKRATSWPVTPRTPSGARLSVSSDTPTRRGPRPPSRPRPTGPACRPRCGARCSRSPWCRRPPPRRHHLHALVGDVRPGLRRLLQQLQAGAAVSRGGRLERRPPGHPRPRGPRAGRQPATSRHGARTAPSPRPAERARSANGGAEGGSRERAELENAGTGTTDEPPTGPARWSWRARRCTSRWAA